MKKQTYLILIVLLSISSKCFSGCDPTQFRWGCKVRPEATPTRQDSQLIYCGATRLWVSQPQFELMQRYQRAGIHMHLLVNNVFYDGPCIPANHKIHHQQPSKI